MIVEFFSFESWCQKYSNSDKSLLTQTINASKTDQNRKGDTATLIHYSLLVEASFPWYSAARRIPGKEASASSQEFTTRAENEQILLFP